MRATFVWTSIGFITLSTAFASAQSAPPIPQPGDSYEITKSYRTSEEKSDGSSGSSSGTDAFLERVIARRSEGLELEYDLPLSATAEDRAREWRFPARVLRLDSGRMKLLNTDQLEKRLEGWLKTAKWDRSICGRWIFTWNAFRIECDPQSIIKDINDIDFTSQILRDGAQYSDAGAIAASRLVREEGPGGLTFNARAKIDPARVRLERAEADVATAEIMHKPISLKTALLQRSKEDVSGTISVTWETDQDGS